MLIKKIAKIFATIILILVLILIGLITYTIFQVRNIEWYAHNNPKVTNMMIHNDDVDIVLTYVPIEQISNCLIRAVLLSEDVAFFSHCGVDWAEFRLSMEQNWERKEVYRGGSTITMQLARNLFLSPSRNPVRKIQEIVIAIVIEHNLSKRRILELYLNVVEWGPYVYGIQSAAMYHYGITASKLTVKQSCALASILPAPTKWNPKNPTRRLEKRIKKLRRKYNTFSKVIPDKALK